MAGKSKDDDLIWDLRKRLGLVEEGIKRIEARLDLLLKMSAISQDFIQKIDQRTTRGRSEVRQAIVAFTQQPNISEREQAAIRKDTRQQTPSPYLPQKET